MIYSLFGSSNEKKPASSRTAVLSVRMIHFYQVFLIGQLLLCLAALLPGDDRLHFMIRICCVLLCIILFVVFQVIIYMPVLRLEELLIAYIRQAGNDSEKTDSSTEDLVEAVRKITLSMDAIALKQKNAEILMKTAEINNLQDQINPHFLYNTLEVIRAQALVSGEKKIAEMTAALAYYFRYNISRREIFVTLKDELKNSMNYFYIQQHRFMDKISCEIEYIDVGKEEVENYYIPKLILQPIIENAIYHGLELKMGPGVVRILITATSDELRITIADDGLGINAEKLQEINNGSDEEMPGSSGHNGVALKNIHKRLKLYWGNNAYLYAESQLGIGTQFHLVMPLLYEPI